RSSSRRSPARALSFTHCHGYFHLVQQQRRTALPSAGKSVIYNANHHWRNAMAMSMTNKATAHSEKTEWSQALQQEFAREAQNHNGCVSSEFISKNNRVRVWTIRLKPGQRFGFHRHVLDYFWTSVSGGKGRQHLMDGSTVEYTYQ